MPENVSTEGNIKREEKLWADVRGYKVATNNARILGQLDELLINEKTGKIIDIVVKLDTDQKVNIKGARSDGEHILVPFSRVEKVGEFIIVTE
ncbi:MAG: PRC-barrel domain-containing protein [Methanobrevibacter sp.]|jgi:sporulation protein YlmC with PRC-barrel domain|nr:PRC-barrel domain-containing protein [Methanobrevibacter sp.]